MAKKKQRPNSITSMTAHIEEQLLDNRCKIINSSPFGIGDFVDVSARMRIVGQTADMRGQTMQLQSDGAFTIKGVKS